MSAAVRPLIVTGHQPTYLPWLGLFHKIALCDIFVFMDDVQFLVGDWNNRNRIKGAQGPFWLTVPTRKGATVQLLKDTLIDDSKQGAPQDWQSIHWRALQSSYRKSPYWREYEAWFEDVYVRHRWTNLTDLCEYMLKFFLASLGLSPRFEKASALAFTGQKSDLVLEHCTRFGADICVFGAHGRDYAVETDFTKRGISLHFQSYRHPDYHQRFGEFTPFMSIVDLLCNHGPLSMDILMSGNIDGDDLRAWWRTRATPGVLQQFPMESRT